MQDPADLSATEAAAAIAAGRLHPAALLEACRARIAAREPGLRAFTALSINLRPPSAAGPLHGLPIGVKDVLDTADLPTAYGSPIYAGFRPRADAAVVALARRAGALIMGKTVTTEFATRHPGPTRNPHHPDHTPGGSSSGSAAAVAAGMVPLAFGTQTAGSIIRPAAYCGVVGFKPSFGTLPRTGMKVCSDSLDTIGIMARGLGDIGLAMSALTGIPHPTAALGRAPRLGISLGLAPEMALPETLALLDRVAALAEAAGAEIMPFRLPPALVAAAALHPHLMNMETSQALAHELCTARPMLSPVLRERMDWAAAEPPARLVEARLAAAAARAAFGPAFAGLDAILTPAAPGEAPAGLESTGDPAFNSLWTLLHGPCVTLPAGTGPKGLPLGIQLAAPMGADAHLLATAAWLARLLG
jgi:amidase